MRFSPVLLVLLVGCSSYARIGDTDYPPRPEDWPVEVFVADSAPLGFTTETTKQESEIPPDAIRLGKAQAGGITLDQSAKGLCKIARQQGGDGILITGEGMSGATGIVLRWKP